MIGTVAKMIKYLFPQIDFKNIETFNIEMLFLIVTLVQMKLWQLLQIRLIHLSW